MKLFVTEVLFLTDELSLIFCHFEGSMTEKSFPGEGFLTLFEMTVNQKFKNNPTNTNRLISRFTGTSE